MGLGAQIAGWVGSTLLTLALATVPGGGEPSEIEIRFETPAGRPDLVTVVVAGLDPSDSLPSDSLPAESLLKSEDLPRRQSLDSRVWREILRVVAVEPDLGELPSDFPSLLGSFSWAQSANGPQLHFRPRFPLAPGLELRVRFDRAAWRALAQTRGAELGSDVVSAQWTVPDLTRSPSTRVQAVFPATTGDGPVTVPTNLLRLYVHFSAPMSAHAVLPHVELLDDSNQPVPVAFVGIPGGLWDPERRRLTLLVHPGRVKRGVGPNQAMGPVLEQGKHYRLRIASQALDADGLPLVEPFEHEMVVGPADFHPPDPHQWTLDLPQGPRDALRIRLVEPADRALLERLPRVDGPDGKPVPMIPQASENALVLTLKPREIWSSGSHSLVIPPELEDPAGNRPGRRFEEAGQDARGPGDEVQVVFDLPF